MGSWSGSGSRPRGTGAGVGPGPVGVRGPESEAASGVQRMREPDCGSACAGRAEGGGGVRRGAHVAWGVGERPFLPLCWATLRFKAMGFPSLPKRSWPNY